MPYIPMTISEKRAIVKQRLKHMGITVDVTDSWLDVQIICKSNGLDITEMLRPQIPDKLLLSQDNDQENGTALIPQKGAKVITPEKEEKNTLGFLPKAKEEDVSSDEGDTEPYTL